MSLQGRIVPQGKADLDAQPLLTDKVGGRRYLGGFDPSRD